MKKTKKWCGHDFMSESGPYESENMKQLFRDFRSDLKKGLKDVGKIVSMHPNHFDITAVVSNMDDTKWCYISVCDTRDSNWDHRILYRSMDHPKDWTGGRNQYTDLDHLIEDVKEML